MEKNPNSKKSKRKLIKITTFCFLFFVFCSLFFTWREIYLPKESGSESQILFFIEQGQGLMDIASNLEKQDLIKSRILFELYALLRNSAEKLQAGRYHLTASMNIPQILAKLIQGDTIKEKITIIEGWTLADIANYFEAKGMFRKEEFLEVVKQDFSKEFDFLREKGGNLTSALFAGLEGYLFPDTYEISEQRTMNSEQEIEEIIRKMLQNFDKKITTELKKEITAQGKTLYEILTMASLLEKEIKIYEDRQIVAGILWKRIKAGWPLQVDATLTYLTGKQSSQLTKEDLAIDSPYNTYKYYGLPLGPICNPGLESIKAAIYYKDSPYWFYLTSPEGETIFSKTLQEHNIARFNHLK